MNGLERILAAVRFEPTDRVPAVPQLFGHAAVLAGVPLKEYVQDGELLARCQIAAQARYGHDAIFTFMDTSVETEAAGSRLHYGDNIYPVVAAYALKAGEDPSKLKMPDPHRDGRMPQALRAAAQMRRKAGDRLLVAGAAVGPMTLATQLIGMEDALFLAADDPDAFERVLDYAAEVVTRFGLAQIEAGAHLAIVFDPSASPAVVPPAFFREFLLPRLRRVLAALRRGGAIANWLDIAGPTAPTLPYQAEAGADIVNFDYYVTPQEAQSLLPHTCVNGNLKSLYFDTVEPGEMFRAATALREAFAPRGGFLLSSGCEIPPEAKPENIEAMVAACRA